jgi:predicted dehydrogenase
MGRWHTWAIRRAGGRVVAVVDHDAERCAAEADRCGAPCYATLEEAIAQAHPDVVHICTPSETHVHLTGIALSARCHAIVEKPLAPSAVDTARLLDLAAAQEVMLCPVHQFLFQHGFERAHRLATLGGTIRHVDLVACSAGAESCNDRDRHRIAVEILPHPLSQLRRLLGSTFASAEWHALAPVPGEIRVTCQMGETTASILVSMGGRPTRNSLRVIGSGGTLHVDFFHGFVVPEGGAVSRARKVLRPLTHSMYTLLAASANLARRSARREPAYPGLRELVERCYAAIRVGAPAPIDALETSDVAAALDRIVAITRLEPDSVAPPHGGPA